MNSSNVKHNISENSERKIRDHDPLTDANKTKINFRGGSKMVSVGNQKS
jgi:hypothetical protein